MSFEADYYIFVSSTQGKEVQYVCRVEHKLLKQVAVDVIKYFKTKCAYFQLIYIFVKHSISFKN